MDKTMPELNRRQFEADPAHFIMAVIKEFVADSGLNCLPDLASRIFEEPLIGFAGGDDILFQDYKRLIGHFHLTPQEVMVKELEARGSAEVKKPLPTSVISWVLPFSDEIRSSMHPESIVPSLKWNHARYYGQELINKLSLYLVDLLESLGYRAVAPELTHFYEMTLWVGEPVSNWSQRHVAYVAGLGTFSLNDGFITAKGMAHRCGSVVTTLVLPASPRTAPSPYANCPFYLDRSCQQCIQRCPTGAISQRGHDKKKCRDFMAGKQRAKLKELGREGYYLGRYFVCGLCQTGVPCEAKVPSVLSR